VSEREERGDPHHHRAEGFIAQVEIVVRETAALVARIRNLDPWRRISVR